MIEDGWIRPPKLPQQPRGVGQGVIINASTQPLGLRLSQCLRFAKYRLLTTVVGANDDPAVSCGTLTRQGRETPYPLLKLNIICFHKFLNLNAL